MIDTLRKAKTIIAVDTETTGVDFFHGCKPFMVTMTGVVDDEPINLFWEWEVDPINRGSVSVPRKDIKEIESLLASASRLIFHNQNFDIRSLVTAGIKWTSDCWDKSEDTMVMSHCLHSLNSHGLKPLAVMLCDYPDDDQQRMRECTNQARTAAKQLGWDIAGPSHPTMPGQTRRPNDGWGVCDTWIPRQIIPHLSSKYTMIAEENGWESVTREYAVGDTERTYLLFHVLRERLIKEGLYENYLLRKQMLPILYKMVSYGTTIIPEALEPTRKRFEQECIAQENKIKRIAGPDFNVRSDKQVIKVLFGDYKLEPQKLTDAGNPSVSKEALEEIILYSEHPKAIKFAENVLAYRRPDKMLSYLDSYKLYDDGTGRIHAGFNPIGTVTTRLSSSGPNLQQVGEKSETNLRTVFGPQPGRLWYSIDYSNIELRLFAYLSGDEKLIAAFERGESVHIIIAQELLGKLPPGFKETDQYHYIKNGNFSLIYGASPRKVNATYHIPGAYEKIRKQFPKVDSFMSATSKEVKDFGYVVTLNNHRLYVETSKPYKGTNYKIQGTAGGVMIEAMIEVDPLLPADHYLIMTVHDELVFDFPATTIKQHPKLLSQIKQAMERPGDRIGIPTPVEIKQHDIDWSSSRPYPVAV